MNTLTTKQKSTIVGGVIVGGVIGYFGSQMMKGKACWLCVGIAAIVGGAAGYYLSK